MYKFIFLTVVIASIYTINPLQAEQYFIHLTDHGLAQKENLLGDSSLEKPGLGPSHKSHQFNNNVPRKIKQAYLQRWLALQTKNGVEDSVLNYLYTNRIIDDHETVGRFQTHTGHSDSLQNAQWYVDILQANLAWTITKGNRDVIVAIIDTGIDYEHPQLNTAIWRNELEQSGIKGKDDDDNGFVDDSLGWDFTDAPRFPDGGDYLDEDNDPMDEFGTGHGTQIAGIIAARHQADGIRGLAPGVRIMNLRAGTAAGYLEEDDVARAILYAIENGADIINMSFGDVALSRFLKQVISYAYDQGVVMVASSGNTGDSRLHYPSGLKETLAVGASNSADQLSGFSSFGNTVDLVAPGSDIVSTAINNQYNSVNGTSFSAPMVSAASALLLSHMPDLTFEEIRHILKTTTDDILNYGWDYYSGAGRLNILRALQVQESGILQIKHPQHGDAAFRDTIQIIGSAAHPALKKVTVKMGIGQQPDDWNIIVQQTYTQFIEDTLGILPLSHISDTLVTLSMTMDLLDGKRNETRVSFGIDRTPPVIANVEILPLLDADQNTYLIQFNTDDICTSQLLFEDRSMMDNVVSHYETRNHYIKINVADYGPGQRFKIEAENKAGLKVQNANNGQWFSLPSVRSISYQTMRKLPWKLPAGYMLEQATDMNNNGKKEIILSRYDEDNRFGKVEIHEFHDNAFVKVWESEFVSIPRAAGDIDKDGRSDLLLGFGKNSFIVESDQSGEWPSQLIWQDASRFWAADYADFDGDGKGEIIGHRDSVYIIMEHVQEHTFTQIGQLPNNSSGNNQFGVPHIRMVDLNNDDRNELVFGDADGDLQIFTSPADNTFQAVASAKTKQLDATYLISSVNRDDGAGLLFTASHTSAELDYEHEFDARHWTLESFRMPDNQPVLRADDELSIYGYFNQKNFDSGLRAVTIEGKIYVIASLFPNLYICRFDEQRLNPVWHKQTARSNAVVVDDFNNDGSVEFYYNTGQEIIGYAIELSDRPLAPYPLIAQPMDSVRVQLSWNFNLSNKTAYYQIHRKRNNNAWQHILQTRNAALIDSIKQNDGSTYQYRIQTVDSSRSTPLSVFAYSDTVRVSQPPRLTDVHIFNDRQLKLIFNEPVMLNQNIPYRIYLSGQQQLAVSVLLTNNDYEIIAGFDHPFNSGAEDTVEINNIFDYDGVPVDMRYKNHLFTYNKALAAPYVKNISWPMRYQLDIQFSQPMNKSDVLNENNYSLTPSGHVTRAKLSDSLGQTVTLTLDKKSMIGTVGVSCYIAFENLKSAKGIALSGPNPVKLNRPVETLKNVFVYPQPTSSTTPQIMFANVPQDVELNIYTVNGVKIRTLHGDVSAGGIPWDLKDKFNQDVASGIYLYEVIHGTDRHLGKLMITR
ncbi:MAG: S8 family serine peptidase [Caldithrix sp.]|nr:S8 family serine peptidase [Caldithrix sp.]